MPWAQLAAVIGAVSGRRAGSDFRRPSAGAGHLGLAAYAGQRQWLLDTSRVKVAACGRRWGKTESEAVDAATWAIVHPGSEQMIVAPTYDQARLIANGVERLLLGSPLLRRRTEVRKTPYPLISIFGSRISARSADDDGRALRGHRADRVIVDEAAFVRDAVISDVVQPMLADSDGRGYHSQHAVRAESLLARMAAGRRGRACCHFSFLQWQSASAASIEPAAGDTGAFVRAEYLAEFVDDASRVFKASRSRTARRSGGSARRFRASSRALTGRATRISPSAWRSTSRGVRSSGDGSLSGLSWEASIERAARCEWRPVAAFRTPQHRRPAQRAASRPH